MKKLSMVMMCLLAMVAGMSVKAQEITVTLNPGWTWISYPKAETMNIATAFVGFTPMQGDMLLSQFASTTYINGQWRGGLTLFTPGIGYMYYSNRTESVSFVFGVTNSGSVPTGAIDGKFTVNADGSQVYFSQGNLQYIGSANTPYWKFADNQWDYLGTTTNQNSTSQHVDRDLFGWGTSGYEHGAVCYQPWSTSTSNSDYYVYGGNNTNLYDQTGKADWGYNPISNGGNQENQWRTLTKEEWTYVFNTRFTTSGIRYAKAKVNGVNGVILLPDDWNSTYFSLSSTNSSSANYDSNTIPLFSWTTYLEAHGAVFLPAAGGRYGTSVYNVGSGGYYWSASYSDSDLAYGVLFYSGNLYPSINNGRNYGQSVRLVAPAGN